MIKNPRIRRTISAILLVLGGVLIFLAPQNAWLGSVPLGAGLLLEVVGYIIRHDRRSDTK